MSKILVLNQGTLDEQYQSIQFALEDTWQKNTNSNVKVINYYGREQNPHIDLSENDLYTYDKNKLIVNTYDFYYPSNHRITENWKKSELEYVINGVKININDTRNEKFILALEFCLENFEFDFIQRISCTSYVNVPFMENVVNKLPKQKIYDGARNMYNYLYYFITGHCVLMSRDVVEQIVINKQKYMDIPYPEDLALGKLLIHDLNYVEFANNGYDYLFYGTIQNNLDIQNIHNDISRYCYRVGKNSEICYEIEKHLKLHGY